MKQHITYDRLSSFLPFSETHFQTPNREGKTHTHRNWSSLCVYILSENLDSPAWDHYNTSWSVQELQIWFCDCLWMFARHKQFWPVLHNFRQCQSAPLRVCENVHSWNKHKSLLCWTISEKVFTLVAVSNWFIITYIEACMQVRTAKVSVMHAVKEQNEPTPLAKWILISLSGSNGSTCTLTQIHKNLTWLLLW